MGRADPVRLVGQLSLLQAFYLFQEVLTRIYLTEPLLIR
jgi:hypothetical protein